MRRRSTTPCRFVVVRMAYRATASKRKRQLLSLQCLDGGRFVDAEHDGVRRRVQVQPYEVFDLLGGSGIGAHFVRPHQVRLDPICDKDFG